ncbi:hypothetical protein J4208_05190 [Candidatus Woesearchaeota archaeon]|nr:hypothetical protein [Candidatus Woesearchaeota archaeon]
MDIKDLPKAYEALQKKYTLPAYHDLNNEFELLYISASLVSLDFPLRFIRRRMADRIGNAVNYLQALLQPNPGSLVLMRESSFFSSDEKLKIGDLLQQMIALERTSFVLDLQGDEKQDAHYIHETFKQWISLKKIYATFIARLPEHWKQQEEKKPTKNPYVG